MGKQHGNATFTNEHQQVRQSVWEDGKVIKWMEKEAELKKAESLESGVSLAFLSTKKHSEVLAGSFMVEITPKNSRNQL